MYSVAVSGHIMIAHSFVGEIFGPAQQLHGATYEVEIELRRAECAFYSACHSGSRCNCRCHG